MSGVAQACALAPATVFILKVAERCNLACSYCYMFEFEKQISAALPSFMTQEVMRRTLERIREHLHENALNDCIIEIHGGEPLLLGRGRFQELLDMIRSYLRDFGVRVCLQSNALLIDVQWLRLLAENEVSFSISLDGPPEINDRCRVTKRGAGTGANVESALRMILESPFAGIFTGVLAVVDPSVDGAALYRYFRSLGLTKFDLLFRHHNYLHPPIRISKRNTGDVFTEAFDEWFEEDNPRVHVRIFEEIIFALLGRSSTLDFFGKIDGGIAVVESDGGLLPHDVLRTCGIQNGRSRLNIFKNSFNDLRNDSFFPWRSLSRKCQECELLNICGGGYAPHRFDGVSFCNPSIYCNDLEQLIVHIAKRVGATIERDDFPQYPLLAAITQPGDRVNIS